jgi:hypothetical protein
MSDSPKKTIPTLETLLKDSQLLSVKDLAKRMKAKELKNEHLEHTDSQSTPRQAGRDWWWRDDV